MAAIVLAQWGRVLLYNSKPNFLKCMSSIRLCVRRISIKWEMCFNTNMVMAIYTT